MIKIGNDSRRASGRSDSDMGDAHASATVFLVG
jgi:hypothetical protein